MGCTLMTVTVGAEIIALLFPWSADTGPQGSHPGFRATLVYVSAEHSPVW